MSASGAKGQYVSRRGLTCLSQAPAWRLAWLLAVALVPACKESAAQNTNVDKFLQVARPSSKEPNIEGGKRFLQSLPAAEQRVVGRLLLTNSSALVAYAGASVLIERGEEDRAIPTLATFVVNGTNDTLFQGRMGYEWVHDDDEERAARVLLKICGHLLDSWKKQNETERKRAELFLAGLDLSEPGKPFSVETARERLAAKQKQLKPKP